MNSMAYGVFCAGSFIMCFVAAHLLFSPSKADNVRFCGPVHVFGDPPLVQLLGESPSCYFGRG
jgi:hypothetical protein